MKPPGECHKRKLPITEHVAILCGEDVSVSLVSQTILAFATCVFISNKMRNKTGCRSGLLRATRRLVPSLKDDNQGTAGRQSSRPICSLQHSTFPQSQLTKFDEAFITVISNECLYGVSLVFFNCKCFWVDFTPLHCCFLWERMTSLYN